ncbi:HAD-IA family hydrolase [Acidimangrovimonas sediminis]|uniref:HAD-IA family hydrolase n=1 Tax=Acidimangrovimonas sediminis TaxID=2056283 RepID=UPI000C7FA243|nr:HAD-IA family hydrolase [Acidimangrovimonas sediminis]
MTDPFRLVIFDVDGTLVDSQAQILAGMRAAFLSSGMEPPPDAAIYGIIGLSLERGVEVLAPGLSPGDYKALIEGYRASFLSGSDVAPLFPGAREVVEGLGARDDILLAIATGKSRRGLDKVMAGHDIGRHFVSVQVSDHHPSKPHPSMIEAVLSETGVPAPAAVMIGDTDYDIEMGRNAGVATIGVTWGNHPPERLTVAGADVVIDDFAQLSAALDRIWGA